MSRPQNSFDTVQVEAAGENQMNQFARTIHEETLQNSHNCPYRSPCNLRLGPRSTTGVEALAAAAIGHE
jgi:hypothetical protein